MIKAGPVQHSKRLLPPSTIKAAPSQHDKGCSLPACNAVQARARKTHCMAAAANPVYNDVPAASPQKMSYIRLHFRVELSVIQYMMLMIQSLRPSSSLPHRSMITLPQLAAKRARWNGEMFVLLLECRSTVVFFFTYNFISGLANASRVATICVLPHHDSTWLIIIWIKCSSSLWTDG